MAGDTCNVSNTLTVGSEPVISFFNKGKFFFGDLPFLQFCKKYDICNPSQAISGCAFGKKTQQRFKEVYHE
jgi:hypothetical protein